MGQLRSYAVFMYYLYVLLQLTDRSRLSFTGPGTGFKTGPVQDSAEVTALCVCVCELVVKIFSVT